MDKLKLAALKNTGGRRSVIEVGPLRIGQDLLIVSAPYPTRDIDQAVLDALKLKEAGARLLKWGWTSSSSGSGAAGDELFKLLREVRRATGLPVLAEVADTREISEAGSELDVLMVGSRNIQNFALLKELGRADRPVLLMRGLHATLEEWLNCAEYILSEGNSAVILCEGGIRTFEAARMILDLSSVPSVRHLSHLPVLVDPSLSGSGRHIERMCLAAVAAGADGLVLDVLTRPAGPAPEETGNIDLDAFTRIVAGAQNVRSLLDGIAPLPPGEEGG